MKTENLKLLRTAILLALIFSLLISSVRFEANCTELKDNILRLHIIANSNSEEDQNLKLMVRDAILEISEDSLVDSQNVDEAIINAENSLEAFKNTAEKVIAENGFDYNVSVEIKEKFFDTRIYDNFTLPAGEYKALCINIGKAEGKNWWCVMYPAVCLPAASGNLRNAVSNEAAGVAENPQKYVIKFKTVEIFEEIKNFFKKDK